MSKKAFFVRLDIYVQATSQEGAERAVCDSLPKNLDEYDVVDSGECK